MKHFKSVGLIGLTLSMVACVPHLSQEQCQTINWNERGYNDGAAGLYQKNLNKEISDCAKFKLTVDTAGYTKGWRRGVRTFCQPSRAYNLGVDGKTYNAVCPGDLSVVFRRSWKKGLRRYCVPDTGYNLGRRGAAMPTFCAADLTVPFRNAYEDGRRIYGVIASMQQEVDHLNRRIGEIKSEISDKRDQIARSERIIARSQNPNKMRVAMLHLANLRDSVREDQRQVARLQKRRDKALARLNREKMR